MGLETVLIAAAALVIGLALGWFLGGRGAADLRADRDRRERDFKDAITDLAAAQERAKELPALREEARILRDERDNARTDLATLKAQAGAFETRLTELREAKEVLTAQFSEVGTKMLGEAQRVFLERADARFNQAGEKSEEKLKLLLQPVETTLKRYEEGLQRVEKDRNDSYGQLREAVTAVQASLGETRTETAKLVNALRAAPKTRGRWGEQQFRNLIELAGLSDHVDFEPEVSVSTEDGNLRPDFIIRLPGDQQLIVDVKCVLENYLQAAEATSGEAREAAMIAHARAVKNHAEQLGRKAYWSQFEKAPDFVIMYIPGDNFLSAALEADLELWERAARNRVIIAGPSAFLPLARTVAAMWRQQKLTEDAQEIGRIGKEMYERLATAATHLKRVGGGLNSAVDNYNKFVASFEGRVLVSARRFEALNVDTGNSKLEAVEPVDVIARAPGSDLLGLAAASDDAEAAE